ncbi:MAG: phage gp6-like head-tail connector protein [Lachnospiraceae bacterium]|nr:phage gp6-like head-tail connector protein [Lachnospiraceae bacterium]
MEILKINLQISTDKLDSYLSGLISAAREYITTEGITLKDTQGDNNLVVMYAAYLYRKRREDGPMPRSLRWALNNRLFSQKAGG